LVTRTAGETVFDLEMDTPAYAPPPRARKTATVAIAFAYVRWIGPSLSPLR
jgi:hypothetical protein